MPGWKRASPMLVDDDVHVSDWNGTTVFASIALYEALHYHGHLLDDSTGTIGSKD